MRFGDDLTNLKPRVSGSWNSVHPSVPKQIYCASEHSSRQHRLLQAIEAHDGLAGLIHWMDSVQTMVARRMDGESWLNCSSNLSLKLTRPVAYLNAEVVSCLFRVSDLANSLPTINIHTKTPPTKISKQ